MSGGIRIKRLERLWGDDRPVCSHAFSLILDGRMVQDDPPCACGGERVTLIAASETPEPAPDRRARGAGAGREAV